MHVSFEIRRKKEFVTNEHEIESIIGTDTFDSLKKLKSKLVLDLLLSLFECQCFDINELMMKKKFFLRVCEFRKKN